MTDQSQPAEGIPARDAQPSSDQPTADPLSAPATDPYGQPSAYGQPPAPDLSAPPAVDPYGQPSAYGQPPAPDLSAPPATDPYGQPSAYGQPPAPDLSAPPAVDPYGQPAAPAYGQPAADPWAQAPGSFGQPAPDPYAQPAPGSFGQPPAGDPYAQPAPGGAFGAQPGYGVQPGYGGAMAYNPATASNNVKLNYWLSVFFTWIPALIFYLTDKDKNQLLDDHLKENMNFQITRVIAWAVMLIPYIGWLVGGLASLALFVIAILGAMKGTEAFDRGQTYRFPFAIRLLK